MQESRNAFYAPPQNHRRIQEETSKAVDWLKLLWNMSQGCHLPPGFSELIHHLLLPPL
jgi:hypothetical protein